MSKSTYVHLYYENISKGFNKLNPLAIIESQEHYSSLQPAQYPTRYFAFIYFCWLLVPSENPLVILLSLSLCVSVAVYSRELSLPASKNGVLASV